MGQPGDANETVTHGVTNFHSGTYVANIIPETATFAGSLRFFNMDEGEKALGILKEICEATAKMHHCTVEFGPRTEIAVGPVINNAEYSALAAEALNDILPEGTVS